MKNLKIVISGYKGFIGRNLLSFLKKKNIKPYRYNQNLNFKKTKKKGYFIHIEFYISKKRNSFFNKNLKKMDEIISFCKENNLDLIFLSTSFIKKQSISKLNEYQKAKYLCEKKIENESLKNRLNYKTLRLSNIYGPNFNKYGVIPDLIKKMNSQKKIVLKNYNDIRDFLFIDDLVKIILMVIKYKKNFKINICNGKPIKILVLAKKIKDIFKFQCKITLSKNFKNSLQPINSPSNKNLWKKFKYRKLKDIDYGLNQVYKKFI